MVREQPAERSKRGDAGRNAVTAKARRFIDDIQPAILELQGLGVTPCAGIALSLQLRRVRKPRGGLVWTAGEIRRLLRRIEERNRDRLSAG